MTAVTSAVLFPGLFRFESKSSGFHASEHPYKGRCFLRVMIDGFVAGFVVFSC